MTEQPHNESQMERIPSQEELLHGMPEQALYDSIDEFQRALSKAHETGDQETQLEST